MNSYIFSIHIHKPIRLSKIYFNIILSYYTTSFIAVSQGISKSVFYAFLPSHVCVKCRKNLVLFRRVKNSLDSSCFPTPHPACPSLSLFARISSALTRRVFVKLHIGDFCENLSSNSKFDSNQTTISGNLRQDISTFILLTAVRNIL